MNSLAHSTVVSIDNEPAPTLTVEAPLPGPLAQNVVYIPYRMENLRIMPLGGPAATKVSPRVGHLHITVDEHFRNAVADQAITLYPGYNASLEQFIVFAGGPGGFSAYPYIPIKDPSTNIGEVADVAGGKKG